MIKYTMYNDRADITYDVVIKRFLDVGDPSRPDVALDSIVFEDINGKLWVIPPDHFEYDRLTAVKKSKALFADKSWS